MSLKRFFVIALLLISTPVLSGCLFKEEPKDYKLTLEVWGVFDDSSDYLSIFKTYQEMNPLINAIRFRKFTIEEYESELLNALAAGQGPDIFMINNAWLTDYKDKIASAPPSLVSEQLFRKTFADVVIEDSLIDGVVWSAPLSVDALALYYNKDLFNAAGITAAPKTWQDFNSIVEKLTKVDSFGNIIQAGASMGTAKNINRSIDILTLLMLQSGAVMTNKESTTAVFTSVTGKNSKGDPFSAGFRALEFYTDFARPNKTIYTWNNRQHYSIDSFVEGRVGMMLNYSWHYNTIARKNEKLRFAVAKVPQVNPDKPVNVANYWTYVVSLNKQQPTDMENASLITNKVRIHEAWEFLKYMTMTSKGKFEIIHGISGKSKTVVSSIDPAEDYLKETKKPAARKDLLSKQLADPILEPFAYGALNAHSWKRKNAIAVEGVFAQMIEDVVSGRSDIKSSLFTAASRVNQLLR